jgi:hypothetical protein
MKKQESLNYNSLSLYYQERIVIMTVVNDDKKETESHHDACDASYNKYGKTQDENSTLA